MTHDFIPSARIYDLQRKFQRGEFSPDAMRQAAFEKRLAHLKDAVENGYYHQDADEGEPLVMPTAPPEYDPTPDPEYHSLRALWWMQRRGRP